MVTYSINKGINKPIQFKGLQGQYIWYFGGTILGALIFFAVLFIAGVNDWLCVVLTLAAGGGAGLRIFRMSRKYGEFGLLKKRAAGYTPRVLRCPSRRVFMKPQ